MGSRECDLLKRARSGDRVAGEELFVTYLKNSRSVQGFLNRALPIAEDREEMLHDIYLQLVGGTREFRGEAQLSTYVYQVARWTTFQKFRRENTQRRGLRYATLSAKSPDEIADGVHASPDFNYCLNETCRIVLNRINDLPIAYRDAVRLRLVEDLTYVEIAEKLNVPINTVSTKIHKGKLLLARA